MRASVLIGVLAGCGAAAPSPPPVAPTVGPGRHAAALDALLAPYRDAELVFGAVVAVVDGAHEEYAAIAAAQGAPAPTPDTAFEIGSVTKVFTSLLLAARFDEGAVLLETPVADLLPRGVVVPAGATRPITLLDLATHRSGLPRLPPTLLTAPAADPYAGYGEDALYADLERLRLDAEPGTVERYSNFGSGLLGHALGRPDGYEATLRAVVLGPLGLDATGVAPTQAARATGHDAEGEPAAPWRFDALAGAGALWSTARDQVRFLRAQLAAARGGDGPLATSMRRTHEALQIEEGRGGTGLGWFIDAAGRRWHNGGTGGFHSFVGFDPARGHGVVVLAATATALVDRLGLDLFALLAGEGPKPLAVPSAAQLDALVGTYVAEGLGLRLVRRGVRLYAEGAASGRAVRLSPLSPTEFYADGLDAILVVKPAPDGKIGNATLVVDGEQLDLVRQ